MANPNGPDVVCFLHRSQILGTMYLGRATIRIHTSCLDSLGNLHHLLPLLGIEMFTSICSTRLFIVFFFFFNCNSKIKQVRRAINKLIADMSVVINTQNLNR